MGKVTALILLLVLATATAAIAQDTTWWMVIVTGFAIEGRNVTMLMGPYPSSAMCTAQIPELRRSIGAETPVQSATCRSNVEVARMVLGP